jgi:acyl-CoA synthetase (AMP-forming)/AMP-acid ligase II
VAILSANDPVAFSSVFGISRAGAVWCPVNPRNEAAENRELLELFDCRALVFQASFAGLVEKIRDELPGVHTWVCLDGDVPEALGWEEFLAGGAGVDGSGEPVDDVAMIVGTGGTTGRPKGVVLTGHNLEAMTAITLMSYPFEGRPVYLALAPLTHAAGVLCFPVLSLGGDVVVMRAPDVPAFLDLIGRHGVSHTSCRQRSSTWCSTIQRSTARISRRCSVSGTGRPRCRRPGSRRRCGGSGRSWGSCSGRPRRR